MGRRIFAESKTTDASGNATFTFSPPFVSVPVVSIIMEAVGTSLLEARVTSISESSVTINARKSDEITLLSVDVLQKPVPISGVTVHLHAVESLP